MDGKEGMVMLSLPAMRRCLERVVGEPWSNSLARRTYRDGRWQITWRQVGGARGESVGDVSLRDAR